MLPLGFSPQRVYELHINSLVMPLLFFTASKKKKKTPSHSIISAQHTFSLFAPIDKLSSSKLIKAGNSPRVCICPLSTWHPHVPGHQKGEERCLPPALLLAALCPILSPPAHNINATVHRNNSSSLLLRGSFAPILLKYIYPQC